MECPSCRAAVLEGSKFCDQCGAPLVPRCPSCGHQTTSGAKFCSECGTRLATTSDARASTTIMAKPGATALSAERRQLTVLFSDIVGSTTLATRLDPEDLRKIIAAYHRCVAEAASRLDGFVAQYMGDGALIYFGYPQAHEDDPERAVRTGLALIDAVGQLPGPERLQLRIGIGTGEVVVGDLMGPGEAQEPGIIGETPNLAARLQTLAEPNCVVIGPRTRRLLGDLFECKDLGVVQVKGFAEPVQAWRVLRPSAVESRFEALHSQAALARLVGREDELELLLRRWARAKYGEGQVVLLSAEPGVGKSRLVAAVQERLQTESYTRLRYFCSPHDQDSALHPIISQLERAAEFAREDTPETKLRKLEDLLGAAPTPSEDIALVAELLSLPSDRYVPVTLSPQAKKERMLQALIRQLEHLSRHSPVLMVFEDAHWIDPTSLEVLQLIVDRVQRLPVLLLATFRPEFNPPWIGQPHVTLLALGRLNRRESASLIAEVAGSTELSADIVAEIVERTDGVPLFIEELTKAVLETGAEDGDRKAALSRTPSAMPAVPAMLHGLLMARLDRLGPAAKAIAQIGAAIGREFPYELLSAVAQQSDIEVQHALDQLVSSGLILQRGTAPQSLHIFKHALVQDAAYGTLLRDPRRELHARIAHVLEEHFPEVAVTQPELLARHCAEGGLVEQAIDYWFAAGERALRTSANIEAIKHLSRGIRLLTSSLPDTPERQRKELRFQTTLGPVLMATKGWGASEAEQAYHRAEELSRAVGDSRERFKIGLGLWIFHVGGGDIRKGCELSDELFQLAEQANDDDLRLQAHHSAWGTYNWRGQFEVCREHAERGLALYNPAKHTAHALTYGGHDPGVCAWALGGVNLWFLGYPERAAEHARRSLVLAEQTAHPPTVGHALHFGLLCQQLQRDEASVREWSERLTELAAEHGLAMYETTATISFGWVLANQGQAKSSVSKLRQGLSGCAALGMRVLEPYHKALLAAALLAAEDAAIGLQVLEETMRFAEESGVRFWDAELQRLKGQLLARLLPKRAGERVEACYREALAVSRRQQARSLELRAATSLAGLWRAEGKRDEARELLAPIYDWFTEGFDTPDLKEAKALLDELCG